MALEQENTTQLDSPASSTNAVVRVSDAQRVVREEIELPVPISGVPYSVSSALAEAPRSRSGRRHLSASSWEIALGGFRVQDDEEYVPPKQVGPVYPPEDSKQSPNK